LLLGLGQVSHLWFEFKFGKFPLKTSNFSIFFPPGQKKSLRVGSKSTRVEGGLASYLLRAISKLGSGQGLSLPTILGILPNSILSKHSKDGLEPFQPSLLLYFPRKCNFHLLHDMAKKSKPNFIASVFIESAISTLS